MIVMHNDPKQGSDDWLKLREGKVTGSIADNLLLNGLDEALKQNYARFKGNYYTQRGHILEEEAIEIYEHIHGVEVARPSFATNNNYPNSLCSPDGIDREYLLEVKCFGEVRHNSIRIAADIPFKIMAQLQFNMMITGLKSTILIMYNPDLEDVDEAYREIVVKADPKIQANMAEKLKGQL